jgi:hypothetical protein
MYQVVGIAQHHTQGTHCIHIVAMIYAVQEVLVFYEVDRGNASPTRLLGEQFTGACCGDEVYRDAALLLQLAPQWHLIPIPAPKSIRQSALATYHEKYFYKLKELPLHTQQCTNKVDLLSS